MERVSGGAAQHAPTQTYPMIEAQRARTTQSTRGDQPDPGGTLVAVSRAAADLCRLDGVHM